MIIIIIDIKMSVALALYFTINILFADLRQLMRKNVKRNLRRFAPLSLRVNQARR